MKPGLKTYIALLGIVGAAMAFMISTFATQQYVDIKHESVIIPIDYIREDVKIMKKDIKELIRRIK